MDKGTAADLTNLPPPERGVFCNRTLNLRSIRAIGYDMDYTLIHYKVDRWERHVFEHLQAKLAGRGWPVDELTFDAEMMIRGLVLDTELGNILKTNRFGYIKQASHGTQPLAFERVREVYALTFVDLAAPRFVFINTLFSVAEVCMYAQLVDMLDAQKLEGTLGYSDLYREVKRSLDETHWEGTLKAKIAADPQRFIEVDEQTPLTLLDQKQAGKRLLLITNSEWLYTRQVMAHAFDPFLPGEMTWRDLFDLVIVSARKPDFFAGSSPLFEVVDEQGLLTPVVGPLRDGAVYLGGHAGLIEQHMGLSGDQILYVGDHIFVDVHVSKSLLRWRTALILRELEQEMVATASFAASQAELSALMQQKQDLEGEYYGLRLKLQRQQRRYGPPVAQTSAALQQSVAELREEIAALDQRIGPLAQAAGQLDNSRWGLLMRAGSDKSHLARQVERYADIYTSRVSNLLWATPFGYLRAPRGSLPHDPEPGFADLALPLD